MSKHPVTSRQIVSANRLTDGVVVHYTAAGTWSALLADAVVYDDTAEAAAAVTLGATRTTEVVGVYAVDVDDSTPPRPLTTRERIRLAGPSIDYLPPRSSLAGTSQAGTPRSA